jgi:pimeloyl-ACP methyl ester carboxylesterase
MICPQGANNVVTDTDLTPPALPLLAREMASFVWMRARATFAPAIKVDGKGNGHKIIVIPGFMASDRTTSRLRRTLDRAGFQSCGWGLGRNRGIRADVLAQLDAQVTAFAADQPVTLIGWSLGGLIAREYAKFAPHRVAKVMTLGTPFSGHLRANNAWRAYELIAGHKVDQTPISAVPHEKPPVPTIAFWSGNDGVVAPGSARGLIDEADARIELACTHMAFVADPVAIHAVITELTRAG